MSPKTAAWWLAALMLLLPLPAGAWEDAVVLSPNVGRAMDAPAYVLQARVFPDESPARALSEELASKGLESYIFAGVGDGGVFLYSVRLSLHDTLYEAMQAARDVANTYGVEAEITMEGSFTPLDFENQVYFVQVVALSKRDNLEAILQDYRSKGYSAGVVRLNDAGEEWYILHVGRFDTFAEADVAAEDFRRSEARPCYVIMMDRDLFNERSMGG